MRSNPLLTLRQLGQSVWLDALGRGLLASGRLARLIEEDGVSGVTSNPAIFERAIAANRDYDAAIVRLARRGETDAAIMRALVLRDVAEAADQLHARHVRSAGDDGFVSVEVSPHLAYDTAATIREGCALWTALRRPNVLIKVPATAAGVPAARALLAEGINVNVTLLFGTKRYAEVVDAYFSALEERRAGGKPLHAVVSVASFFVSRIDTLVDAMLDRIAAGRGAGAGRAAALRGRAATACACDAFRLFMESIAGARFRALRDAGARPQRLVWASTGTKDPAYPDTKYVDALVAADTISTLPPETLEAYRAHGRPRRRLPDAVREGRATLRDLALLGIGLDEAAVQLEREGVRKFQAAHDRLRAAIALRRSAVPEQEPCVSA
ncbi:transaldolase [Mizugakiibacter sediminis]|uniref:Transaldolase n=1 Tax=Mizugakiibacter sediminis TaxID=1475481 RepID=A0A0K8QRC3_9GAMM|nr:transaldolase [Mizugakiibacter sediminis]GAP66947.1 transaldolase [Mizugakiibacter sediminis]